MMREDLEDDLIILHDMKGVNLTVGFFLDTEKSLYSICWDRVNVRVELLTFSEQISDLPFTWRAQQLFIDDNLISGEVIDFRCERTGSDTIKAFCKIVIQWD
jgi:hypothetical protein